MISTPFYKELSSDFNHRVETIILKIFGYEISQVNPIISFKQKLNMEPGKTNQETDQYLQSEGYNYDEANKAYYKVTQEGVNKLYGEQGGNTVCEPDSNRWEKPEDKKSEES